MRASLGQPSLLCLVALKQPLSGRRDILTSHTRDADVIDELQALLQLPALFRDHHEAVLDQAHLVDGTITAVAACEVLAV